MNSFSLAFNVALPIFIMLGIGYIAKHFGWLKSQTIEGANSLIFRVTIPILLFFSIYSMDLNALSADKIIIIAVYASVSLVAVMFIGMFLLKRNKNLPNTKKSVIVQTCFRGNVIIFGFAVVSSVYGPENTGIISAISLMIVPLANIMSVFLFENYRKTGKEKQNIFLQIIKNPLVISPVIGIVFLLLKIKLPVQIETPLRTIGNITTPLAFILLGGTINFASLKNNKKILLWGSMAKLIIVPFIILTGAILMGFRGIYLGSLMGGIAAPSALVSFTVATEMGGDGDLAAQYVVTTTVFSVVSIFLWVFVLDSLSLI